MENQGIRGSGSGKAPIFVPTHLSGLKVRSFNPLKPPVELLPMNKDDENIPMGLSVASVASAAMDAMPDREVINPGAQ